MRDIFVTAALLSEHSTRENCKGRDGTGGETKEEEFRRSIESNRCMSLLASCKHTDEHKDRGEGGGRGGGG